MLSEPGEEATRLENASFRRSRSCSAADAHSSTPGVNSKAIDERSEKVTGNFGELEGRVAECTHEGTSLIAFNQQLSESEDSGVTPDDIVEVMIKRLPRGVPVQSLLFRVLLTGYLHCRSHV